MKLNFLISLLIICLSFSVPTQANAMNYQFKDDLIHNLNFLKTLMRDALENNDSIADSLNPQEALIFSKYKRDFTTEIRNLKIQIQDRAHFVHFGRKTWIETDISQGGEIRIDIKELHKIGTYSLSSLAYVLSHEIAHHFFTDSEVTQEIESQAWQISNVFMKAIQSQLTSPKILELKIGDSYTETEGCHQKIRINKIDLKLNKISAQISSYEDASDNQFSSCRIYTPFMTAQNQSPRFYDTAELEMQCKTISNQLFCFDLKPKELFRLCPQFLDFVKSFYNNKFPSDLISTLQISNKKMNLKTNWCVFENTQATFYNSAQYFYVNNSLGSAITRSSKELIKKQQENRSNLELIFTSNTNVKEIKVEIENDEP